MKPNSYFVQEREPKGMDPDIEQKILKLKSALIVDDDDVIESLVIKKIESLEVKMNSNLSEEELQEIQKKIDMLKKYSEADKSLTDDLNERLQARIKNYESQQVYDIDETAWELIDSNTKVNNGVVFDFSKLIDERVFEVEDIENTDYYAVFYTDWAGWDVIAIVNYSGRIIVKQILDYEILANGHIIIEANGLKDGLGHEDDRYVSVIDDYGNEVIPPIKNIGIEYDARNNLYVVGKKVYFDIEGNQAAAPPDDEEDDE
ncbi:MAG: hypothetical protein ACO3AY_08580 [Chitinophagaceae bacterium]